MALSSVQLKADSIPAGAALNTYLEKAKCHPNALIAVNQPNESCLTNMIYFTQRIYTPQESGISKSYTSLVQPSVLSTDLQSLHLIPRTVTGLSGQLYNIYASSAANESMHAVELEFRKAIASTNVLYLVQARVDSLGFLEITQKLINDNAKIIRKATIKDDSRRYNYISDPSWIGGVPKVSKLSKACSGKKAGTKIVNPFWDLPGREEVTRRIREQKIASTFPIAELVHVPKKPSVGKVTIEQLPQDPTFDFNERLNDLVFDIAPLTGAKAPVVKKELVPKTQIEADVTDMSDINPQPTTTSTETNEIITLPQLDAVDAPSELDTADVSPTPVATSTTTKRNRTTSKTSMDFEVLSMVLTKVESRKLKRADKELVKEAIGRLMNLI